MTTYLTTQDDGETIYYGLGAIWNAMVIVSKSQGGDIPTIFYSIIK